MSATINHSHIWRNDITGLRAVAVLPVLLFHAFPSLLPGGFFGVDVFFVISGYLISGIIFRGLLDGTFSYRTFYEKRIKRIIPNLLLLLTFVSVLGYGLLLPDEFRKLGQHICSSAGFFQNFRLLNEAGYFTEDALRRPLLHLWSLAIEEQFYIVFPIICAVLWRLSKSRTTIGIAVFLITFGSLAACLSIQDKNFTFYFPLTRFWELGAGIALAFVESYGHFQSRQMALWLRNILSCAGLAAIIGPMAFWSAEMTHPGWVTLLPVLGSVSLIAANPDAFVNKTLLSWRPMTFIGLISYSLYLWHWPLLAFLFICIPHVPATLPMAALAASFVLAAVVYYFVETPVRRSKNIGKFSVPAVLLIGLIIAVAWGQLLRKTDGLPYRDVYPEVNFVRATGDWDEYKRTPKIPYAGSKIATRSKEFPSIIFAGDSHAVQYFLRAKALSEKTDKGFGFLASEGCLTLNTESKKCPKEAHALYEIIKDQRVKTLVVGAAWGGYLKEDYFLQSVNRFKTAIQARPDLKVYVLLDPPWTSKTPTGGQGDFDPLLHFNRFEFNRNDFIVPYPKEQTWLKGNDAVTALLGDSAELLSAAPDVCPDKTCDLLKWYRDDDHLQPIRVEKEGRWIDKIFN